MKIIYKLLIIILTTISTNVYAQFVPSSGLGSYGFGVPAGGGTGFGPVGNAQLNLGPEIWQNSAQGFINLFHGTFQNSYNSGATPAALDQYGYPVRNFSGDIGSIVGGSGVLSTTGPWTLGWDTGRGFFRIKLTGQTVTLSGAPGCVSALIGVDTIEANCSSTGTVTINFVNTNPFQVHFLGAYTNWTSNTSGHMWLIRASDQTAFTNGTYWTPEFVSLIRALHPESLRPVGWNAVNGTFGVGSNVINWGYRSTINDFSFGSADYYPPGTRCGGSTSFCTMTVSSGQVTSAAATDTSLAGWVDGEQITGILGSTLPVAVSVTGVTGSTGATSGNCKFTVASTTGNVTNGMVVAIMQVNGATECNTLAGTVSNVTATTFEINVAKGAGLYTNGGLIAYQHLTITGKAGGSKVILIGDHAIPIDNAISSGNVTFTYNATLGAVLVTTLGISNAIPIEAQIQLANLTNAGFWYNIPAWANNTFITNSANLIKTNLNTNTKAIFEWSNEVWNAGQLAFHYSARMGWALGLHPYSGGGHIYQSLINRIVNGYLIPNSNWGNSSRVRRMYCVQSAGSPSGLFVPLMSGSSLPSPGSAAYQAYVTPYITNPGVTGYGFDTTVASGGNGRPIDYSDEVCFAPYVGGGTAFSGGGGFASQPTGDFNVLPTTNDLTLLNAVITAMNSSDTATATSLIDQSIRGDYLTLTQNVTASGTTFTATSHGFNQYDYVRFRVSGGTTYSGVDINSAYRIQTVPNANTFTIRKVINGVVTNSDTNAGSAGSGTTTVGLLQSGNSDPDTNTNLSQTLFGNLNIYLKWQDAVVNGFSPPRAGGNANIRWYEGNLEPSSPTDAQCSSLGITGTYNSGNCGVLANAVEAWKNSITYAPSTVVYYYKTFMGTQASVLTTGSMPNAVAPSWLVLLCGNIYALSNNCDVSTSSLRQTYYGFQSFSTP